MEAISRGIWSKNYEEKLADFKTSDSLMIKTQKQCHFCKFLHQKNEGEILKLISKLANINTNPEHANICKKITELDATK